MSKIKVFVTGASGLVGFHLVAYLCQRNYQVIACLRATSKQDTLLALQKFYCGLSVVVADLFDSVQLREAMSGCAVVVHTAAEIDPCQDRDFFQKVNVEGTRSVLTAAIQAKVQQFIHLSSLSVITGNSDRFGVTEEEIPKYGKEEYLNSKIDAEKMVMAETRIQVTALRPGFIYGPNERTWMPRLFRALETGRIFLVGNGSKETNVIYVGNLCYAISLAILNEKAFGQIYNLTDGQAVTKKQLFDTICDELGVSRVKLYLPCAMARLISEGASLLAAIAPKSLQFGLSRYSHAAFRLVAVNQGFDITKAEQELNYIERIPFSEGMAQTIEAWKQIRPELFPKNFTKKATSHSRA